MSRRKESFLELLVTAPWWVSIIFAFLSMFVMLGVLPAMLSGDKTLALFIPTIVKFAPFVFLFFLCVAGLSAFFEWKKRTLVEKQTGLESLKDLSWKEFEWMVGEAYRRKGYVVEESIKGGPDGGIDLMLRKDGRKVLVQCKRWKKRAVGAPIVRELYGLLTAENADEAIVVVSGKFTREAERFAEGKPITLVDGPKLLELVAGVQKVGSVIVDSNPESGPVPDCPKCGELMVLRSAKRGKNVGQQFWGCSKYPNCRGTLPVNG